MKNLNLIQSYRSLVFLLVSAFVFVSSAQAVPPPPAAPTYVAGNINSVQSNDGFTYPAPYGNFFWGARHQFLVLASELTAAGATAGNISSLYFNVASIAGTPLTGFEIKR